MTNNISHDSPCFVGFTADKAVPEADVGLLVDVDVPWFPSDVQPNDKAFWAHIDIDTLKPGSPMWTFPGNMRMQGDSGRILDQVLEALKAKATPRFKEAVAARLKRIKAARDERIARAAKLAADKGRPGAINPHYLTAELGKLLDDQDMIFNEGVTNAAAVLMQISPARPQHDRSRRRRRAGLVRRHRARRQARRARSAHRPDLRRRRFLFRQSEFGIRRRAAI